MIILYSGTPGSGKSLHQADNIYYWLKMGRPCITNYEIDTSKIKTKKEILHTYISNDELTPDFLKKYSRAYKKKYHIPNNKEGVIRLFIDEAQILFNAREWQKFGRSDWLCFFSQHRKYGYDIYLVAQYDRMIDRQVRSLIEYEYIHRKVSNVGKFGKIFSVAFGGFISIKMYYPLKERLGAEWFRCNKKIAGIYNSYKDFDDEEENNILDEVDNDVAFNT